MRTNLRGAIAALALATLAAAPAGAADFTAYYNGPVATGNIHSQLGTMAPAGAQWSEFPTATNTIFGFGISSLATLRLADDFTTTQTVRVVAVTVMAYDTGTAASPVFNAATLQIWDGRPGDLGSNVLFGDTTTNRLTSSTGTNFFRVTRTVADTARHIQEVRIEVNPPIDLPVGTYWIDYDLTPADGAGGFNPPVTILGQTGKPGANSRQLNGGTWSDVNDTGAMALQDIPFTIVGDDTVPVEVSGFEID